MLNTGDTALLVIDVQEKLARVMHEREALIDSTAKIVRGANALGVPLLLTEQYPKGLGPTVPEVAAHIKIAPIEKLHFDCCGEPAFLAALSELGRRQLLVCGIEAHVCVYQTAAGLLERGFGVHVVADAVSSRTARNRDLALQKMASCGVRLTSVEMALFELLKVAGGDVFKQVMSIVK